MLDSWPIPSPGLEAPPLFPTIHDLSLSLYTATDAPAALRWLTSLTRLRLRRRRAAARRGAVYPAALLELLCALAALPHLEELEWEFEPQLAEVAEGKANPAAASHPLAGPQPAGAGLAAAAALLRRGSPGFPKLRALVSGGSCGAGRCAAMAHVGGRRGCVACDGREEWMHVQHHEGTMHTLLRSKSTHAAAGWR